MSSTDSTLCAQPCYCQTVETHSCVSASCQVFATGDFIRQSCLPRRKNASLQVFVELTKYVPREGIVARILSHAERREARNTVSWPKPFGGKLETLFPDPNYSAARYRGAILAPRGAAGKNCRTILVPRGTAGKNCRTILVPCGTAERNCRTILVSPERRQAGDNEQSCPTGIVGTRLGAR